MKSYIRLMRIKHYVKNLLIFMPLFFAGKALEVESLIECIIGFGVFSLAASFVYVVNDILDVEADRRHETKKCRPIACGDISVKSASRFAVFLLIVAAGFSMLLVNREAAWALIFLYVVMNVAYSVKLKKVALVDVSVIAIGFIIRISYGGFIIGVPVSNWMYLTVMAMSFYLALGKRRNELLKNGVASREVLRSYTRGFLDKMMYVFLGLAIVFYSLWCVSPNEFMQTEILIWTVPLVILICMRYSMNIECEETGDPADVFFGDRVLVALAVIYSMLLGILLYFA